MSLILYIIVDENGTHMYIIYVKRVTSLFMLVKYIIVYVHIFLHVKKSVAKIKITTNLIKRIHQNIVCNCNKIYLH